MCGVHSTNSVQARADPESAILRGPRAHSHYRVPHIWAPCAAHATVSVDDPELSKRIEGSRLPRYTAAVVQLSGYGVGPNTC